MNASSPVNDATADRSQLHLTAALISELGLTDVTVERIYEVMESTGSSFVDAARHLAILRRKSSSRRCSK